MICKYNKKCPLYEESSLTCTKDQHRADGSPYCGKFREFENEE